MASSGKAGKVKEWFAENYPPIILFLVVIGVILGCTFGMILPAVKRNKEKKEERRKQREYENMVNEGLIP